MRTSVLEAIRHRRVARFFTNEDVTRDQLLRVLQAGRWAPSAGNRRVHRFVVVSDLLLVKLVRAVSPGVRGFPRALVIICIDWLAVARAGCNPHDRTHYIDVGTAAQNMLLAAEAVGLGAGPVTSFSRVAVATVLDLPDNLTPELMICLGQRAKNQPFLGTKSATRIRLDDLVIWREAGESGNGWHV